MWYYHFAILYLLMPLDVSWCLPAQIDFSPTSLFS